MFLSIISVQFYKLVSNSFLVGLAERFPFEAFVQVAFFNV